MQRTQIKRILLIDDHEMVREGVKRIFDGQPGGVVFGEATSAADALPLILQQEWDVVILDLSLGHRNGLELLKQCKDLRPKLPVLVLSMHSEEQYARRAFKAGAAGYITKDCPRAELLKAINKVFQGKRYVSSALAEKLVLDLGRDNGAAPHEALSDRELEVLLLIASGKTVGEISRLLSLSGKTISTYRARILEKMSMKTNAELTHHAIRNNLVG